MPHTFLTICALRHDELQKPLVQCWNRSGSIWWTYTKAKIVSNIVSRTTLCLNNIYYSMIKGGNESMKFVLFKFLGIFTEIQSLINPHGNHLKHHRPCLVFFHSIRRGSCHLILRFTKQCPLLGCFLLFFMSSLFVFHSLFLCLGC